MIPPRRKQIYQFAALWITMRSLRCDWEEMNEMDDTPATVVRRISVGYARCTAGLERRDYV